MQTIHLSLGKKSYPIYVGKELFANKNLINHYIKNKQQVMIVTNTNIAKLYLEDIKKLFSDKNCQVTILPDGEIYKNLEVLQKIYHNLLENRFDRGCVLVALGGGVIGDITGFAAATYQRGIDFIQIPTTLLAHVDSSVGGKTGVNHSLGKNMIGAFYQPKCVLIDTNTLITLPNRELIAGISEIIKYGILGDLEFFNFLEKNIKKLLALDSLVLEKTISHCCKMKADIVAMDEKEANTRALLNLGHTFGHAIENSTNYNYYLHGEAIAIGMVMAAEFSYIIGNLSKEHLERIIKLIKNANLPITINVKIDKNKFFNAMSVDKKVKKGKIILILLESIGKSYISDDHCLIELNTLVDKYLNALN